MLPKMSIKRPVTTVMIMLIAILGGVVSLLGLNMDLLPEMNIPIAVVSTTYVGAGPQEIETLITKPVEQAMGTVPNVKTIMSSSATNSSMVIVEFEGGTDLDMASIDMREKIDLVKGSLPETSNEPLIVKMDVTALSSIMVGVSGNEDMKIEKLTNLVKDKITNRLEKIDGVAAVNVVGGAEKEIEVVVSPEKLLGHGLTVSQLSSILNAENSNYPVGSAEQGTTKLSLRATGQFESVDEIRELPIMTPSGAMIHLSDVSEVNEVTVDNESYAIINGKESIVIAIDKQSNANTVDISKKINKELESVRKDYPNIQINMLSDTAQYIQTAVSNVLSTAFQAALMAIIVLLLFLRDPKPSLIIAVSIPTSIIATFALMYVAGITLNIISLGGITIGVGMLVDNSVVVLENIFRHFHNGVDAETAAKEGTTEVSMAITASTLTTVSVFVPLMFVQGTVGQIFKDLSLTISFSLIASLIVSLTFVPMMCSRLLKKENKVRKETKFTGFLDMWGRGLDKIDSTYRKILGVCLNHKKKTLFFVLIAFIATLALVPIMGMDFMPAMDQGSIGISVTMPKGTVIDETSKIVDRIFEEIDDIGETDVTYVLVGGGGMMQAGTDSASITLNLVPNNQRKRSSEDVAKDVRERLKGIPGAEISVATSSSAMGSYGGSSLSIEVNGDDSEGLKSMSEEICRVLSGINGFTDVKSSIEDTVPEASIKINRTKASAYGLNTASLAGTISNAVRGTVATQYKVGGSEMDIKIKQSKDSIKYLNDIKNLYITTPTGTTIPLSEVAEVSINDGLSSISRKNQHRYVTISATLDGLDMNSAQKAAKIKLDNINFPEGYSYKFAGNMETMNDSFRSLGVVLIVAILLVYMIMASQFESLIYPFIILFSMPLAITGGIFGLFITGQSITLPAFMGFIMLVGMVVNNAIVLVDYANQLMEKGMSCKEALLEAGPTRLRPILMTTLTTIIGLVPLALAVGEGTEMQQPMGIVVIFGMTISTIVTLVFIPVVYAVFDKLRIRSIKKNRLDDKKSIFKKKSKDA